MCKYRSQVGTEMTIKSRDYEEYSWRFKTNILITQSRIMIIICRVSCCLTTKRIEITNKPQFPDQTPLGPL